LGFDSPHRHVPAEATQDDLLEVIAGFNADHRVHAVLIQYPIPGHLVVNDG
jgi:methylenetetrahydrofolate dehydrogenase (NADP+) / methenyltetrahydrofolate cyclohydrolase